jgi:hypothetical protein
MNWTDTAYHESGHALAARHFGRPCGSILVRPECSGEARYYGPQRLSEHQRATITISGALAESWYTGTDWQECMSGHDSECVLSAAMRRLFFSRGEPGRSCSQGSGGRRAEAQ